VVLAILNVAKKACFKVIIVVFCMVGWLNIALRPIRSFMAISGTDDDEIDRNPDLHFKDKGSVVNFV